ncbi:MAG TPA: hypothetical protein VHX38_07400, partial [Pseudonocardiaceae bacterium]|nr:hypothetical protein [Pseudonocardiaceae bacterium]
MHGLLGTGEHDCVRAVDRSQSYTIGQQGRDLGLGGLHRDHRSALGQRLHQPCPSRHQTTGVRKGQNTGHMRCRDLADRMADQIIRTHAPGRQQPKQGNLDGEQRRLRLTRRVDLGIEVEFDRQMSPNLIERLGEHRIPGIQFPTHPHPLRTLTRKHKHHTTINNHTTRNLTTRKQHRTMLEHRTTSHQ